MSAVIAFCMLFALSEPRENYALADFSPRSGTYYMDCACGEQYSSAVPDVTYRLNNSLSGEVNIVWNSQSQHVFEWSHFTIRLLFAHNIHYYTHLDVVCTKTPKTDRAITVMEYMTCGRNGATKSIVPLNRRISILYFLPDKDHKILPTELLMRAQPADNVLLMVGEAGGDPLLYYEYNDGDRVTFTCSKSVAGISYYLDFNGTAEALNNVVSRELSLHSWDDNTTVACSLCDFDCATARLRTIQVLLRQKHYKNNFPDEKGNIRNVVVSSQTMTIVALSGIVACACAAAVSGALLAVHRTCRTNNNTAIRKQHCEESVDDMRPGLVTPIPSVSSRSSSLLDMFPTSTYDYTYCAGAASSIAAARARAQAIDAAIHHRHSDAAESHQYIEIDEPIS